MKPVAKAVAVKSLDKAKMKQMKARCYSSPTYSVHASISTPAA